MITLKLTICLRLGPHQGIIKYFNFADPKTGAIKLAYAKKGVLVAYIQTHEIHLNPSVLHWWLR
jgi:hypothetical protein